MRSIRKNIVACVTAAMILCPCLHVSASENDHREHDAHAHGHGMLNVVVEGDQLMVEFEIPAVNVVGFEHAPSTDDERHAVREALETFGRGESLFVPTRAAECRVENVEVSLAGMEHEEGESHGHEHQDSSEDKEAHSELHGEYHFHCATPHKLESLEVRLFDHLRDVDEIDVQLVTPRLQKALELRAESAVLRLARK